MNTPVKKPNADNKPASTQPAEDTINSSAGWAKAQQDWAKQNFEKMQAHADRYFTTDEELPLSRHLILVFSVLFFVVFVLWASFAPIDEVTRGQGKVIPSGEVQIIQSLDGGIVDEFMIREGDEVTANQIIMRLRNLDASSDLGVNQAKYLGLLATIARLRAEAEGKATPEFPENVMKGAPQSVTEQLEAFRANTQSLNAQLAVYQQQLAQREQEVRELNTRAADLREVIRLSRSERDMIAPLVERGSAPKIELIQLERGLKEKQSELNSALSALPRAQSAVAEAKAKIDEVTDTVRAQAQTELSAKQIEMNAISQTLGSLEDRKTRTEIRSPVNGTIKDLKINTVGGVVKPGDPIVEIVPKDDQLLVEAQIRPSDIAFLYPGQAAVVKITAYDFSIYGGLKGELVDISADSITNEKGESFYRVKVRTNENSLKRKGEVLPIIPGMVASVDIMTGKKTVMEYILKPLIKTVDGAMRER
ncbi:HlyD family type I secretion periplasmic adaptor subunit [Micavibrio aeruginosavorus]|uniref:Type I secretion membrane fusion, HlyD family protein n=1 Tax=Micavibrio aeruginosavorus (strain ARL-13) TaxID=856793 RepID=G2KMS1_MICAA|nr:HlyD family type I secretion periplasmic adaptor subunit [Micavibrio aeruginosavorus]AEP08458.1 type I secretion membrane fusion, HlyD family protein [Micavibrio aeruginosavorus ARL-13]